MTTLNITKHMYKVISLFLLIVSFSSIGANAQNGCSISCAGNICPGTSTNLCGPNGAATYLWSTGETTSCITVKVGGTYMLTLTNDNGVSYTCSQLITVKNTPSCLINGPTSVCPGESCIFSAPAGLASYVWSNGASSTTTMR